MSLRILKSLPLLGLIGCTQLDESSITTGLGSISRIEVQARACNSTLERVIELDVAASGQAIALEGLQIVDSGLPDGDLQLTPSISVAPRDTVRIRCVDHRPETGDLSVLDEGINGRVRVTLATEDDAVDPLLWATFTSGGRAFDNCQNVLTEPGCTIVSEP